MIELQTSLPSAPLRRFVRLYVQRRLGIGANLNEPVLARLGGLFEFHFAGLYRVPICGTDRFEHCAPTLVVGPISRRRVQLQADGAVEALTVMFQPHGLYELLGVPTHLLAEHAEEAHALLGRRMPQLYEALGNVSQFADRVDLLNAFLLQNMGGRRASEEVNWGRALDWFVRSPDSVRVRQAATSLNTTVRQLERKALDYGGMSPQTMRRVARFGRALRLRSNPTAAGPRTWTEIAHHAGYYDQQHMVREFRILGGAVPTSLTHQLEPHHGTSLLLNLNR